jgi:hypothetical protein
MEKLTNGHLDELKHRIHGDIAHFQGRLPERHAIAWRAYLGALLEWSGIDIATYDNLVALLPVVDDDPAVSILRGRD